MVLYRRRNAGWEYWEAWPELVGHQLRRGLDEPIDMGGLGGGQDVEDTIVEVWHKPLP